MLLRIGRKETSVPRVVERSGGFTLVELMIALTVLLIGISGILAMQLTSMRATAYSRHATEAAVIAEDTMEVLRTQPSASLVTTAPENVDAQGIPDPQGYYTREWTVTWDGAGTLATLTVIVRWFERGVEPHAITLRTQRNL